MYTRQAKPILGKNFGANITRRFADRLRKVTVTDSPSAAVDPNDPTKIIEGNSRESIYDCIVEQMEDRVGMAVRGSQTSGQTTADIEHVHKFSILIGDNEFIPEVNDYVSSDDVEGMIVRIQYQTPDDSYMEAIVK